MSDTSQGSGASGSKSMRPPNEVKQTMSLGTFYCSRHTAHMPQLHATHTVQHVNTTAYRDGVPTHVCHTAHPTHQTKHTYATYKPHARHPAHSYATQNLKSALPEFKDHKPFRQVASVSDRRVERMNHHRSEKGKTRRIEETEANLQEEDVRQISGFYFPL